MTRKKNKTKTGDFEKYLEDYGKEPPKRKKRKSFVTGKTPNQKQYIKNILGNDLNICIGPAGTGKSYIAIGMALELFYAGEINKIYLTRPMEHCGRKGLGSLPGSVEEKFAPYMAPLYYIFNSYIGEKDTNSLLENNLIEFLPLELMRGMTFENCVVILDEFQNASDEQAAMAITRMGRENCRMIFIGDLQQIDVKDDSGLELLHSGLCDENDLCACIEFTEEDNQRHKNIQKVLKAINWNR